MRCHFYPLKTQGPEPEMFRRSEISDTNTLDLLTNNIMHCRFLSTDKFMDTQGFKYDNLFKYFTHINEITHHNLTLVSYIEQK